MIERVLGAPFVKRRQETVTETEFIYTLSGDQGWFTPEESEDVLEKGIDAGLLAVVDEDGVSVRAEFDTGSVDVDESVSPDYEEVVRELEDGVSGDGDSRNSEESGSEESVFETVLDRLVDKGYDRKDAVARINRQHRDLGNVNIDAAAVLVAKNEGVEVGSLADRGLRKLREEG